MAQSPLVKIPFHLLWKVADSCIWTVMSNVMVTGQGECLFQGLMLQGLTQSLLTLSHQRHKDIGWSIRELFLGEGYFFCSLHTLLPVVLCVRLSPQELSPANAGMSIGVVLV